jgi:glycosyltransferase involved in cell wall biosynthesis
LTSDETLPGLVSVMMPAYNAEKYIQQAIESLLVQTYVNWELILVNDGSTDTTLEIALRFADPRINIVNQPNGGEASARNTALANMHGEFVSFLDADDAFLPDHLQVTVTYLNAHPERGGVYVDGMHIDQDGRMLKSLSSRRRGPYDGWVFEQVVRAPNVFGPPLTLVLRRRVIVEYNLSFDTRIGLGTDWDFYTRYAEQADFGYLEQKTCLYRIHQTNMTIYTRRADRARSHALCREKAIKLKSFSRCSLEIRSYAFYELLVELLNDEPERQAAISRWPEFLELPAAERARLFRLMATGALSGKDTQAYIREWLKESHRLDPSDLKGRVLYTLYRISPRAFRLVVNFKRDKFSKKGIEHPYRDLFDDKNPTTSEATTT